MAAERNTYSIQVPDAAGSFLSYFHDNHTLQGLDSAMLIRWCCVVLVWMGVAFWHQRQNRAFHEYIRNTKTRTPISDRLSQLAYNRAFEILAIFFALILTLVFYDTRLLKDRQQLAETRSAVEKAQTQLAQTQAELAIKSAALEEATRLDSSTEETQSKLDAIKQRFEELFINYYYLQRCGLSKPEDFHIMNSALMYELTQLNAPAGIRQNILTAAKGTHDELYAQASCAPEETTPMQESVRQYLQSVIDTLPN